MQAKDLSILIPSRNEMFLSRTIEDVLANIEADTEVIAVLDGVLADPPIPQHERVSIIYLPESIGQRAATNLACNLSKAKYVMKCDAHCAFDKGFDIKMLEAFKQTGDNVTMVPTMRNLWAFDWKCHYCGFKKYQGPTPEKCDMCGKGDKLRRKMIWVGKEKPQSNSYCFDAQPHFQYFNEYTKRPEYLKDLQDSGLTETMSLQGSCWMLTRDKYWELNICDENFGSWGSQGIEVATKTWLSGGKVLVNHETWYAHMFRTQGGDFGFPYPISFKDQETAKDFARNLFFNNNWDKQVHPLSWLVEKFWPVKGWTDEDLQKLKANTFRFSTKNLKVKPAESEPTPIESEPTEEMINTNIEVKTEKPVEGGSTEVDVDIEELTQVNEGMVEVAVMLGEDETEEDIDEPSSIEPKLTKDLSVNSENGVIYYDGISNVNLIKVEEMKVTIIGNSWVGKSVHNLFPNAYIYNPPKSTSKRKVNKSGVAFICLPTPSTPEGKLDISIIEECLAWCECPLIVIRSTVNPGTCDYLSKKYNKRILMQPEYLNMNKNSTPLLVIGGEPKDRRILINLYTTVYNSSIKIRQVTAYEAEVIKLSENRAISFKVAQCQELYDVCEKAGVDYYTIREAVYGDDPRFTLWYTSASPNSPEFISQYTIKDLCAWYAWAESLGINPEITRGILERNKKWLSGEKSEQDIEQQLMTDNEIPEENE